MENQQATAAPGRNLYFDGQHGAEDAADTAQRLALVQERDEAVSALNWICRKLNLPEGTKLLTGEQTIAGTMHNVCAAAHGYEAYIKAYKCDDKQGEIARLTVALGEWASKWQQLRRELAELRYPGMTGTIMADNGGPVTPNAKSEGAGGGIIAGGSLSTDGLCVED